MKKITSWLLTEFLGHVLCLPDSVDIATLSFSFPCCFGDVLVIWLFGDVLLCNKHLRLGWLRVQDGFFTYMSGRHLIASLLGLSQQSSLEFLVFCSSKRQQPTRIVKDCIQNCHSITVWCPIGQSSHMSRFFLVGTIGFISYLGNSGKATLRKSSCG